jgi:hypothetical protein
MTFASIQLVPETERIYTRVKMHSLLAGTLLPQREFFPFPFLPPIEYVDLNITSTAQH